VWDVHTGQIVKSFAGNSEDAFELIMSPVEERLANIITDGIVEHGDQRRHVLFGDMSNIRSIANWASGQPVALESLSDEIAVRDYNGEIGWLPEHLRLAMAGNPVAPQWAVGRGNHLMIFALQGWPTVREHT
jgi:hypothetical protein